MFLDLNFFCSLCAFDLFFFLLGGLSSTPGGGSIDGFDAAFLGIVAGGHDSSCRPDLSRGAFNSSSAAAASSPSGGTVPGASLESGSLPVTPKQPCCHGKKKDNTPCRNRRNLKNGFCRHHGGQAPRGSPASSAGNSSGAYLDGKDMTMLDAAKVGISDSNTRDQLESDQQSSLAGAVEANFEAVLKASAISAVEDAKRKCLEVEHMTNALRESAGTVGEAGKGAGSEAVPASVMTLSHGWQGKLDGETVDLRSPLFSPASEDDLRSKLGSNLMYRDGNGVLHLARVLSHSYHEPSDGTDGAPLIYVSYLDKTGVVSAQLEVRVPLSDLYFGLSSTGSVSSGGLGAEEVVGGGASAESPSVALVEAGEGTGTGTGMGKGGETGIGGELTEGETGKVKGNDSGTASSVSLKCADLRPAVGADGTGMRSASVLVTNPVVETDMSGEEHNYVCSRDEIRILTNFFVEVGLFSEGGAESDQALEYVRDTFREHHGYEAAYYATLLETYATVPPAGLFSRPLVGESGPAESAMSTALVAAGVSCIGLGGGGGVPAVVETSAPAGGAELAESVKSKASTASGGKGEGVSGNAAAIAEALDGNMLDATVIDQSLAVVAAMIGRLVDGSAAVGTSASAGDPEAASPAMCTALAASGVQDKVLGGGGSGSHAVVSSACAAESKVVKSSMCSASASSGGQDKGVGGGGGGSNVSEPHHKELALGGVGGNAKKSRKRVCHYCNLAGHIAVNCPKRKLDDDTFLDAAIAENKSKEGSGTTSSSGTGGRGKGVGRSSPSDKTGGVGPKRSHPVASPSDKAGGVGPNCTHPVAARESGTSSLGRSRLGSRPLSALLACTIESVDPVCRAESTSSPPSDIISSCSSVSSLLYNGLEGYPSSTSASSTPRGDCSDEFESGDEYMVDTSLMSDALDSSMLGQQSAGFDSDSNGTVGRDSFVLSTAQSPRRGACAVGAPVAAGSKDGVGAVQSRPSSARGVGDPPAAFSAGSGSSAAPGWGGGGNLFGDLWRDSASYSAGSKHSIIAECEAFAATQRRRLNPDEVGVLLQMKDLVSQETALFDCRAVYEESNVPGADVGSLNTLRAQLHEESARYGLRKTRVESRLRELRAVLASREEHSRVSSQLPADATSASSGAAGSPPVLTSYPSSFGWSLQVGMHLVKSRELKESPVVFEVVALTSMFATVRPLKSSTSAETWTRVRATTAVLNYIDHRQSSVSGKSGWGPSSTSGSGPASSSTIASVPCGSAVHSQASSAGGGPDGSSQASSAGSVSASPLASSSKAVPAPPIPSSVVVVPGGPVGLSSALSSRGGSGGSLAGPSPGSNSVPPPASSKVADPRSLSCSGSSSSGSRLGPVSCRTGVSARGVGRKRGAGPGSGGGCSQADERGAARRRRFGHINAARLGSAAPAASAPVSVVVEPWFKCDPPLPSSKPSCGIFSKSFKEALNRGAWWRHKFFGENKDGWLELKGVDTDFDSGRARIVGTQEPADSVKTGADSGHWRIEEFVDAPSWREPLGPVVY